ncbi:streptomycin biosynthesis protein [Prauserella cavernicola]|uniref:streptomycin biosynthesis protein n=1 Tax=Prauserella cavernicola TaxID=2800127 RepID=UPI0027DBDB44|nr:streptomycin biosynthesis protein [Prauserella cavernicola]
MLVAIDSLLASDSPRLLGESDDHVRVLAESDLSMPPLIVSRATMRVIDGMHRLCAARMKGEHAISVCFFEGDERDAFLVAVKANAVNGLPLTAADRKAAATRIIAAKPEWSDRAIAEVVGLSAKSVAAIRATADGPQLHSRIGRDGKHRPLDAAEGRRRARRLIQEQPTASLREIAQAAGISPGTVRDVRARLAHREETAPELGKDERNGCDGTAWPSPSAVPTEPARGYTGQESDAMRLIAQLRKDPALRFSEAGRTLLRMLGAHPVEIAEWRRLAQSVPAHRVGELRSLAQERAGRWREFASLLQERDSDAK